MQRKGMRFRKAKHLGWREAQEGDTYWDGEPIEYPYVVIVRLEDCEIIEKEGGRKVYNADNAPPIDLTGHSRTNMAYGTRRKYENKNYDTQSVYWVEDAIVYRGSQHREMERRRQPKNAWYDSEGRYYPVVGKGLDKELASMVTMEIRDRLDNPQAVFIKPTRMEEEGTWDVFIHESFYEEHRDIVEIETVKQKV